MKVERIFISNGDDDRYQLVMFQNNGSYGVASIVNETAMAIDYTNSDTEQAAFSTFKGNELNIIDWVPYEVAKARFLNQLNNWLSSDINNRPVESILSQPALTLVEKV